jgi:hypothetical protein
MFGRGVMAITANLVAAALMDAKFQPKLNH